MSTNQEIVTTPFIDECAALLKNCQAAEAIGVVTGANGSGKTWALKALEGRYKALGLPGECFNYRACQVEGGATKGVRDLLIELGAGGAALANGASASLQLLAKITIREFRQRNIQCLLIDEADLWAIQTLAGCVTLFDLCAAKGWPITLILAGALRPEAWVGAIPSARSRTLHILETAPLTPELMAAVLKRWGAPFELLVDKAASQNKDAAKVITAIHKGCAGNFRRLRYFSTLCLGENPKNIDREIVDAAFAKMINK